jgi:glycosyltransferase involved in cell wall biosynthesis
MKKILFIVNIDLFFVSHRLPVAIEAINNGFEVHVATKVTECLEEITCHGIKVHNLDLHRSNIGMFALLSEFYEFFLLIKKLRPDLMHLVTIKPVIFGGIAARIIKVPAVVSAISGLGYIFTKKGFTATLQRKIVGFFYYLALNHSNQNVIFQNNDDRRVIVSLAKLHINKTSLIPGSGVDLTLYKVKQQREDCLPVVMFASRLLVDKGVRDFVRAAEMVNANGIRARFVLVGDIDLLNPASIKEGELAQWKESGFIEVWGYSVNMESTLPLASIICLPSYREGFPKILMEAAACGRAIITTDVPGCKDAIENNVTGILVSSKNPVLLAKSIGILLNNKKMCKKMGISGRKRSEKFFDMRIIVDMHMEIYNKLLKI